MSKWLVKIQGYEYETNIDELKQWVIEGRVLPEDMIFRQGLGWRIAREVPMLREAFEEQRKRPPSKQQSSLSPSFQQTHAYQQASQYTLPTLFQRAMGFWLDDLSYGLFAAPGFLLLHFQKSAATLEGISAEEAITSAPYILMIIGLSVSLGINIYSTSSYGATPGKLLVGTVVLDRKSKTLLSYGKSAIREALRIIICGVLFAGGGLICYILQGIFCGWLVFDSERRQLYDLLIGANVYDNSDQSDMTYKTEDTLAERVRTAIRIREMWEEE